jgi:hypothetical protein
MDIITTHVGEGHGAGMAHNIRVNWLTLIGAATWLSVIIGQLGNADTFCGLLGQESEHCGARSMLVWLGSQAWSVPTILFIGLVLMLIGERKTRRKDMSDALNEMSKEFTNATSDISKKVTAIEGRVAHCEEAVRLLSGEVGKFRSTVQEFRSEVGAVANLVKEKSDIFETIETFALRNYKTLNHHLSTQFEPWINQVTMIQNSNLQEFRMFNDHTVERLERLEGALAEKDIVALPDTTNKPTRM